MSAEIVNLREGPNLSDIIGQLRSLADRIESGEEGDVSSLFVVIPRERDYPTTFGWGIIEGAFEPIIQFELARQWLIRAAVGLPVT